MFGLMLTSTHEAVVRDLRGYVRASEEACDTITAANSRLREDIYALDRTAAMYKQEAAQLRAQLQPFLDRRERAKLNLKQYRQAAPYRRGRIRVRPRTPSPVAQRTPRRRCTGRSADHSTRGSREGQ